MFLNSIHFGMIIFRYLVIQAFINSYLFYKDLSLYLFSQRSFFAFVIVILKQIIFTDLFMNLFFNLMFDCWSKNDLTTI